MTEVELVVNALVAGATAGITSASSNAIQETYTGLRDAVRRRLSARGRGDATVLDAELTEPDEYRTQLHEALAEADVAEDQEIIDTARLLLRELGSSGDLGGSVKVDAREVNGLMIGKRNIQINT